MKFYKTGYTFEFSAILKSPKPQWAKQLQQGEFLKEAQLPLKLELRNVLYKQPQWQSEPFLDVLQWGNKPNNTTVLNKGSFMVISPRLKTIFEQFRLPPELRFYPVELKLNVRKQTKPYFLMYTILKHDWQLWFEKCCYEEVAYFFNYTKNTIESTTIKEDQRIDRYAFYGENTTPDFRAMIDFTSVFEKIKYVNDKGYEKGSTKKRRLVRKVFAVDYDVLWGGDNYFIISEAIKEACEIAGITGIGLGNQQMEEYLLASEYEQRKQEGTLHRIDCKSGSFKLPKEWFNEEV